MVRGFFDKNSLPEKARSAAFKSTIGLVPSEVVYA